MADLKVIKLDRYKVKTMKLNCKSFCILQKTNHPNFKNFLIKSDKAYYQKG